MSLLVLVPSRGRPTNALELLTEFEATKKFKHTTCLFVVDEDDPELDAYLELLPSGNIEINESIGSMVRALNAAATLHSAIGVYNYIGFFGDDHRPRTKGWDKIFVTKLDRRGGGFAYGNDLYQGANLPTQVVMSSSIISALGWMAPPVLKHLWVDNAWRSLGSATGRLFYFPEVVIEHLHPFAGKAAMDMGYQRVNSSEMIDHDKAAFARWMANGFAKDVETLKRILAA
jgi:hypothetical protein